LAEKRILIIDADTIAYRNAAAMEVRSVDVTHLPSGRTKSFDNRTAFKDSLKAKNFEYIEKDYSIKDVQRAGSLDTVRKINRTMLEKLQEFTWADEVRCYVGSSAQTFRSKLELPSEYKGNRTTFMEPVHLRMSKYQFMKEFGAESYDGIECDDVVSIIAYQELAKGNYPIIVTNDKDANQSQGVQVLNWMNDPWNIHEIPDVGSLHKVKTAVKGDGLAFLAFQTLAGDPTDHYKPYELSNVYYGATNAMKALQECKTEQELLLKVISEYKRLYPEPLTYTAWNGATVESDWKHLLGLYWQCAYMKRSFHDQSNFWSFAARYGIDKDDHP
jgi:hypothetical protein